MERESRGDLLKTLEAQKEKIHRYETKLKGEHNMHLLINESPVAVVLH